MQCMEKQTPPCDVHEGITNQSFKVTMFGVENPYETVKQDFSTKDGIQNIIALVPISND